MSDDEGSATVVEDQPPAEPRRKGSFIRELPFLVLVAFVLALLIKAFLVQAFYIPSGSMERTLLVDDRVLVNKLVYRFRDIHRGEVVVFNGLDSFSPEVAPLPPANGVQRVLRGISSAIGVGAPGEKDFIKRVIGVPGDRVACCTDGKVTVQPAGSDVAVPLEEPYVYQDDQAPFCKAGNSEQTCPSGAPGVLVPEGRLWVLGDHRSQSSDSRAHIDDANSGTVPADKVIGRAFVIVWPLDRASVLEVPATFDQRALALTSYGVAGAPLVAGLGLALPVVALRRRLRRQRLRRSSRG
ncbi:MAG: signal peptidase I [Actinomycetota bacterium]|jgi:signal peptidase I|nr:signal peptidase I [Actinomycetota bacterium]